MATGKKLSFGTMLFDIFHGLAVPYGNIHEINAWKCPIQTRCEQARHIAALSFIAWWGYHG